MSHPVDPGNYTEPGRHNDADQVQATGYADSGGYVESGGSYASGYTETSQTQDVSDVSVGQIMGNISQDLSTLMRQELELAKAEVTVEAKKAGKAGGMLGAAGLAGYFTLLFASITLWWALAELLDDAEAWAALIVTVLWGIVAAVLAAMGKKKMQQVNPKPERTVETLQEAPSALKPTN